MINLTREAFEYLKAESARTGRPMNMILEDLLMGRGHFPPDLEEWLNARSRELNVPRPVLIERILMEKSGLRS